MARPGPRPEGRDGSGRRQEPRRNFGLESRLNVQRLGRSNGPSGVRNVKTAVLHSSLRPSQCTVTTPQQARDTPQPKPCTGDTNLGTVARYSAPVARRLGAVGLLMEFAARGRDEVALRLDAAALRLDSDQRRPRDVALRRAGVANDLASGSSDLSTFHSIATTSQSISSTNESIVTTHRRDIATDRCPKRLLGRSTPTWRLFLRPFLYIGQSPT